MDTAAINRHMTQQHPEWVAKFSRVVQALTTFRRTVVFPCRYLAHTLAHLYRLASLLFPGARQSRMTEMFEDLDMSAQERLFSQADYSVMHWQMGKNTETATLMALIKYVVQFSD